MRIWVGYHDRLGIVIFDQRLQRDLESSKVRLWLVNDQKEMLFKRSAVRAHLTSLEKHLNSSGLTPLTQQHGIVGQVAKRYFTNHPILYGDASTTEVGPEEIAEFHAESSQADEDLSRIEAEYWNELNTGHLDALQEISSDQEAWAHSEENGWFYDD